MELTEREILAQKQQKGYSEYMKTFFEITWNKVLSPAWFVKDNGALFVRVFLATIMFLILMDYIGSIYTEWELGTQAGQAAFLIMKVWFSYKLFEWCYPRGIVERAHEAANRFTEIRRDKKWLKTEAQSVSE